MRGSKGRAGCDGQRDREINRKGGGGQDGGIERQKKEKRIGWRSRTGRRDVRIEG